MSASSKVTSNKVWTNCLTKMSHGILISVLSLYSCSSALADSSTHLQKFSFDKCSFTMQVPNNFVLTEKMTKVGPVYAFSDQTKDKAHGVALMVGIIPLEEAQTPSSLNEFMNGVLEPFKSGLTEYKEERKPAVKIAGNVFENRVFSGNFPKGTPTSGFLYVAVKDNCFVSLTGDINGTQSPPDPKIQLMNSIKSFK